MVFFLVGNDSSKFRINEAIFRFGADVRSSDDMQEAQLRLIRDGEAMTIESSLSLTDNENEELEVNDGIEDEL